MHSGTFQNVATSASELYFRYVGTKCCWQKGGYVVKCKMRWNDDCVWRSQSEEEGNRTWSSYVHIAHNNILPNHLHQIAVLNFSDLFYINIIAAELLYETGLLVN